MSFDQQSVGPATGDPAVDAALRSLTDIDRHDLDAVIEAGERLERDLASRLGDVAAVDPVE